MTRSRSRRKKTSFSRGFSLFKGVVGGWTRIRKHSTALGWRLLRWLLAGLLVLALLTVVQVLVLRWVPPPVTVPMVCYRIAQICAERPCRTLHYEWVALRAVSSHLRRAVIAAEDQRFLKHQGFDLVEIRNAVADVVDGERLRGASTISMQTARSVFLIPSRSVLRKALEAYYTVLIEKFWSKRRILEIYLNTVDWGEGIFGAEAAARAYFKVTAADLTQPQAALMAAILPNPHRLSPQRPGPYLRQRQQRILADMDGMPLLR
jgi:monofunctional biosynthetic peptidoglycan transglycosylase